MTMSTPSSPTTSSSTTEDFVAASDVFEVKPGVRFSRAVLRDFLPDVETALFFGKVYGLDPQQLGDLLLTVHETDLTRALFGEGGSHSTDLQDYLLDGMRVCQNCGESEEYHDWCDSPSFKWEEPIIGAADKGQVNFKPDVPHGEVLPEVWKQLEVEVAKSIAEVAAKLTDIVGLLPGKKGSMVFQSMLKLNAKRPTLGDYRAKIEHAPVKQNLVILDVSGSMSEATIRTIVSDVVALSYVANASMAIVSDKTTFWEPGAFDVSDILAAATYGGTHYETLYPLFDRDWGTVICVADYDSSNAAKEKLRKKSKGHIDVVVDVSLVPMPTYLAECVGQMADKVRPILIANSNLTREGRRW